MRDVCDAKLFKVPSPAKVEEGRTGPLNMGTGQDAQHDPEKEKRKNNDEIGKQISLVVLEEEST